MRVVQRPFFQRQWLRLWIPNESATLCLQSNALQSANGFRSQTEKTAILTRKPSPEETERRFFRQVEVPSQAQRPEQTQKPQKRSLEMGFHKDWRGRIQTNHGAIEWKLRLTGLQTPYESLLCQNVRRFLGIRGGFEAPNSVLQASGEILLGDARFEINEVEALAGTLSGTRFWNDSLWFTGADLESIGSAATKNSTLSMTALSFSESPWGILWENRTRVFRIVYNGQAFKTTSFWDSIQSRMTPSSTGCEFEFSKGPLLFRGKLHSRVKDQTGISLENTDGTLIHTVSSEFADLEVQVYRGQKLEATFGTKGRAAFERAAREKNPYVAFVS